MGGVCPSRLPDQVIEPYDIVIWIAAYIATIFGANWAIQTFGFVPVGFGLMAPAGVYFVGAAFTFRDLAHESVGRRWVIVAIVVGAGLSAIVSPQFALASGVAFLLSELADFAVYTPLRERGWLKAVALSNAVGLVVDSVLFLWLAFGSLEFLPGQIVGKTWMTVLAIALLWTYRLSRRRAGTPVDTAQSHVPSPSTPSRSFERGVSRD